MRQDVEITLRPTRRRHGVCRSWCEAIRVFVPSRTLVIKQPHVSLLLRNRSGNFSVERLVEFLTALGQDVEITVRPTRKRHGEMSVVA
jgi:hypothetical protein